MAFKILRCGWCGCFCDNTGRVFEASKQLVEADKSVGFADSLGTCSNCDEPTLDKIINDELLENRLSEVRSKFNKKLSTGY
jgi:hypothetical protein